MGPNKSEIQSGQSQFVAFSGPRILGPNQRRFVGEVVEAVLSTPIPVENAGRKILTGCAVGADAEVIQTAVKSGVFPRVYTILDEEWTGGWKDTNTKALKEFHQQGGDVVFRAGGALSQKLTSRLRARTIRMLNDLSRGSNSSGLVAFWTGSRGTEMTIEEAIKRKFIVVIYPLTDKIPLPLISGGYWAKRGGEGIKSRGYVFRPAS